MKGAKSGMCLGDDLPVLHKLCRGTFLQSAGEMETSREQTCHCDCHYEGTTLGRIIHPGSKSLRRVATQPS